MKKIILSVFVILFASLPVMAAEFKIIPEESEISFKGTHAGMDFTGKFEKWSGKINFDQENLKNSNIEINIDTSSAKTGNKMYDGTLPTDDWFSVKNFPEAKFTSKEIIKNPDETYNLKGILTIRNIPVETEFNFKLENDKNNSQKFTTKFSLTIDRLAFDIGKKSDAKAEWVSKDIKLDIYVSADKL